MAIVIVGTEELNITQQMIYVDRKTPCKRFKVHTIVYSLTLRSWYLLEH
jgi:hypothetical protein